MVCATVAIRYTDVNAKGKIGWASLFVWAIWAGMTAVAAWLVWAYGRNVPLNDDWFIVPAWTGNQPLTASYLWDQHNNHRIPIPKLLLLSSLWSCGDFRITMYANVAALSFAAAIVIRAASALRGRISLTDAIFPLVYLHWGHAITILWSWQIAFVGSTVLATILLALVARYRDRLPVSGMVTAWVCLILLPLFGGNGVALAPAMALWLLIIGWKSGYRWGLLLAAGSVLAVVILYFVGYRDGVALGHPPNPGIKPTVVTTIQFLSQVFYSRQAMWWPSSGIAALALWFTGIVALIIVWQRQPEERLRALGFGLFLGSLLSLALALGWGRAGLYDGKAGVSMHYGVLAIPMLPAFYLIGVLWKTWTERHLQIGCLLLVCQLIPDNFDSGSRKRGVGPTFGKASKTISPPALRPKR